ncbi:MAG: PEP-CTERM sorting domain-containing protein [Planctomyces sp.]|nr:PEP-CTERM sorting domain-containing protein [Planctomyces sp.]
MRLQLFVQSFMMATLLLGGLTQSADAAFVIDTNPTWNGRVNSGWQGSGQSMTIDAANTTFDQVTFYFDSDSNGRTFDLKIFDAMNGGTELYSTSFTALTGATTIGIGQSFVGGSQIWVEMDYRGFTGLTAHFSGINGYAGGNSVFGPIGGMTDFATLDHRFIAEFSGGSAVPEPASLAAWSIGLVAMTFARRRRSAKATT